MSDHVNLSEDAISEILLRLAVKSLQRFKCVSKSCHLHPVKRQILSLVHSSETHEFKTKHFQLTNSTSNNEENLSFAHILGPCNGIFCIFDGKDGKISLWNPANRQVKTLPRSRVEPPPDAYPFDVCVGFGFDDESNDFRVLAYKHMCYPSSSTIAHAELYALSTNEWKEVRVGEEFQPTGNLPYSSSNPTIDGIFSWFEIDNRVEKVIFSFDVKTEVFMKTRLPDYDGIPSKRVHGSLACLRNSLAFIHDYPLGGGTSKFFDVWILGEYGVRESWVKQLTVGPVFGVTAPLGLSNNGELLLENDQGKLVSYDPVEERMRDLQAQGVVYTLQVLPYKESLVCLKNDDDDEDEVISFGVTECEEENILQLPLYSDN